MLTMLERFKKWHTTKPGLLTFALIELALVYVFVSLSIDRGNFLYYLMTLILLIGVSQNIFTLLRKLVRKGKVRD